MARTYDHASNKKVERPAKGDTEEKDTGAAAKAAEKTAGASKGEGGDGANKTPDPGPELSANAEPMEKVYERHRTERKEMGQRHGQEMRDMHGRHSDEMEKMGARHEKDISRITERKGE